MMCQRELNEAVTGTFWSLDKKERDKSGDDYKVHDVGEGKSARWEGIFKLTEEMSELTQVLMKLTAFPDGVYPDPNNANLIENLLEEIADTQATLDHFCETNEVPMLWRRYDRKRGLYRKWGLRGT